MIQQQANKVAEDFIEKFRVKGGNTYNPLTRKVRVHVMCGGIPEKGLMVRLLEKDGVVEIAKSFRDSGIHHPMEIIGVIWANGTVRLDPNNFQVDLLLTIPPHTSTSSVAFTARLPCKCATKPSPRRYCICTLI